MGLQAQPARRKEVIDMAQEFFAVIRISRDDIVNALPDDAGSDAVARVRALPDERMRAIAATAREVLNEGDFWYILYEVAEAAMGEE
jgi:hypothetical protein